jgi:serine/threonine protein kinase
MFVQIAEGLEFLHGQYLMHRDVKPANILIDSDGDAYLADLGLTKTIETWKNSTAAGTPSFMPPEVCLGDYNMESDLWSLCATFYWVFKKRGPYYPKKRTGTEGENVEILMNKWQCINYEKITEKE